MFSIITATYNRAHCLSNAIESVLDQNRRDWELIVVDDGSTDDTQGVVNKFPDPRIKYIYFSKNRGVNAVRNHGIRIAKNKWIVFLDSDNALAKNALNIMAAAADKYNFPFVRFVTQDQRGKFMVHDPLYAGFVSYRDFLGGKLRGEYHSVIRADLLKRYPFPEDINGGEGIIWTLIVKELGKVLVAPETTIIYDNASADRLSNVFRNISRICNVHRKDIEILGNDYRRYFPFRYAIKCVKRVFYCAASQMIKLFL